MPIYFFFFALSWNMSRYCVKSSSNTGTYIANSNIASIIYGLPQTEWHGFEDVNMHDIFKSGSFGLRKSIGYGCNVTVCNVSSSIWLPFDTIYYIVQLDESKHSYSSLDIITDISLGAAVTKFIKKKPPKSKTLELQWPIHNFFFIFQCCSAYKCIGHVK